MTLQHVSLEVRARDMDACIAFYRLLGFTRIEPPASLANRATWLKRGSGQIHLQSTERPVVPPAGHHAVVVDDYERTLSALREAGFSPESRREHWGSPRAFVRDPAGHRVELMASPPPAS